MSVREEGGKEVKLLRATVLLQEVKPVSGAPEALPNRTYVSYIYRWRKIKQRSLFKPGQIAASTRVAREKNPQSRHRLVNTS
jgi:hypothetical protein